MKNKTIIFLFGIIALALIIKFGLSMYAKFNITRQNANTNEITKTPSIDSNYDFTFDDLNYEFKISSDQLVEKSSTGKIQNMNDKYSIIKDGEESMSLTFLPKDTERFLDQTYSSYLEEQTTINGINGSVFKNNGQNIAYLLKDEKYDYLWINNDFVNFDDIVMTFKKK